MDSDKYMTALLIKLLSITIGPYLFYRLKYQLKTKNFRAHNDFGFYLRNNTPDALGFLAFLGEKIFYLILVFLLATLVYFIL